MIRATAVAWAIAVLMPSAGCGGDIERSQGHAGDAGTDADVGSSSNVPSCSSRSQGADHRCGASHDMDCCAATLVPGGTFDRLNDSDYPATVSPFRLDVFEVTVGRFRAFVDAYPGSRPKEGDGAHPVIDGSGWKASWDFFLLPTAGDLRKALDCMRNEGDASWTAEPAGREDAAIACMTWQEAFAFCAWDGGRLPTLAEWDFAARGGDEQRRFPWGEEDPTPELSLVEWSEGLAFTPVGSVPKGAGRWGQLDFGGSRFEFMLDDISESAEHPHLLPDPCVDCAELDPALEDIRVMRDASFVTKPDNIWYLDSVTPVLPDWRQTPIGFRCARDP